MLLEITVKFREEELGKCWQNEMSYILKYEEIYYRNKVINKYCNFKEKNFKVLIQRNCYTHNAQEEICCKVQGEVTHNMQKDQSNQ
uniref:Uncharacterized protein n=1 Tax=Arion vulgaris TaxID=1028688 RepID=A0A0B7AGS9_9EUPU